MPKKTRSALHHPGVVQARTSTKRMKIKRVGLTFEVLRVISYALPPPLAKEGRGGFDYLDPSGSP
jgi:hypothetical protein